MEFLTGPILAVLGVLGLAMVTDPQSVYIGDISVPHSLERAGYNANVVETRLLEEMRRIEAEAKSAEEMRSLASDRDPSLAAVIGESVGALEFVRTLQSSTGLIAFSLEGEIVEKGASYQFALRGENSGGATVQVALSRPQAEIDELIADVALTAVEIIDPYVRAAYQFQKDLPDADFSRTKALIAKLLLDHRERQFLWGTNLAGMVRAMEGDQEGALATFDRALALDPAFTPVLLNRGILLAESGRPEEAIAAFRGVVEKPAPYDAPTLHAAAYTEWGIALMGLGYMDDAENAFRYAVASRRDFGEAYEKWSELLSATGRTEEAAEKHRMAERHNAETIIHTEQLVGFVKDRIARRPS